MGKMGEQLCFKLWPVASGNYRHLDDTEKVMQQRRHFGIERRFAFRQRTVQIINNELFQNSTFERVFGQSIVTSVLPSQYGAGCLSFPSLRGLTPFLPLG